MNHALREELVALAAHDRAVRAELAAGGALFADGRRKLGLSQGGLARRVGVSGNVVIRYEGEKYRPRAETLDRIAGKAPDFTTWS